MPRARKAIASYWGMLCPALWEAVVTADRGQFERLAATDVTFPDRYGERRFPLPEGETRIGRSRGRPGEEAPEIDLAAPPLDPGISRLSPRGDDPCPTS